MSKRSTDSRARPGIKPAAPARMTKRDASKPSARRRDARTAHARLPDPAEVLAALDAAGVPLAPDELARRLGAEPRSPAFDAQLDALAREGRVLVNRKGELCIVAKLGLVTGKVQGHPDGYGFLVPDDGGDDLFLSPREMHKLLHGDRAAARALGVDRRGRPRGRDRRGAGARQPRRRRAAATRSAASGSSTAENRRINQDLLVPPDELDGAKSGQVVVVEIIEQPSAHREAVARVMRAPRQRRPTPAWRSRSRCASTTCRTILARRAQRQAKRLPDRSPAPPTARAATTCTALPLVTIDGETREDFDDAVYCERKRQGLAADRRDRRRIALRARRRRARRGRARARHVRLLPASRDPDAARGAVERALLAEARRRPPVHGLRHGGQRAGRDHAVPRSTRR